MKEISVITNPKSLKRKLRNVIGDPIIMHFMAGDYCDTPTLNDQITSYFAVWILTTEVVFGAEYTIQSHRNDRIVEASLKKPQGFTQTNGAKYSEWNTLVKDQEMTESELLRELENWISCEAIKTIIKSKHLQKLHKLPKQLRVSISPITNYETIAQTEC